VRVFVLGGTGVIGSAVVRELIARGHELFALARSHKSAAKLEREEVRVVGSEGVRWPLVHSEDLAKLYALAMEHAPAGSSYIGAAIEGFAVSRIARAFAARRGTPHLEQQIIPADEIATELGEWARGYALDQQLSGAGAQAELGWRPGHLDPEAEIAALAWDGG
jgi:nucleoside-diphosphate-sugar epimerase